MFTVKEYKDNITPSILALFGWGGWGVTVFCFILSQNSLDEMGKTNDKLRDLNAEISARWELESDEVAQLRRILFNLGYSSEEIHTPQYLRTLRGPDNKD